MDYLILDNPLRRWALAIGIAAGLMLVVLTLRAFIGRRLANVAPRTATRLDDFAQHTLKATYITPIVIVCVYAGSLVLDLPARIEAVLMRIAIIAFLLQLAVWGDRAVRAWRTVYHNDNERPAGDGIGRNSMSILSFTLRLVLWVVIALMVLDNLGVNITALVASLGVGGIAVALAVQNILGDLFASLSIVLDRPFVTGDFIIVGDALGSVENIGLKTTRLRALGGEQIVFSNAELLKSRIHNQQRMQTRRVAFIVRVSYQSSEQQLRTIPAMIREAVESQDNVIFERSHFSAWSESSIDFETVYHVQSADYLVHMDTQQAIFLGIFSRFAKAGVVFAYPTRVVRTEEGRSALSEERSGAVRWK
ncbi:MAG: mechanosensitive ion channel family protein [Massilia sp.]